MNVDNLSMSVLVLILVVPLGSIALSYRAHREAALLRLEVQRFEQELAYWRETGGRLMKGLVHDQEGQRAATPPPAPPAGADVDNTDADAQGVSANVTA